MALVETLRVIHIGAMREILSVRQYRGTKNCVVMPFRKIAEDVLHLNSRALILSHNHPSGNPIPSGQDVAATRRLAAMLDALDVRLYDHIIIGVGGSLSFRNEGLL